MAGNVVNYADPRLDRVRVRDGRAGAGGGVPNVGGTLTVKRSVIDHNAATNTDGIEEGGGISSTAPSADSLVLHDSTVAYTPHRPVRVSRCTTGLEVASAGVVLERVTVARNGADGAAPGGIRIGAGTRLDARGTLVAQNAAAVVSAAAVDRSSSCDGPTAPVVRGGNFADTGDYALATAPADPRLSPDLTGGFGGLPVLALAPGSPALDLAGGTYTGMDQRGGCAAAGHSV